jgi:hypothetical protein
MHRCFLYGKIHRNFLFVCIASMFSLFSRKKAPDLDFDKLLSELDADLLSTHLAITTLESRLQNSFPLRRLLAAYVAYLAIVYAVPQNGVMIPGVMLLPIGIYLAQKLHTHYYTRFVYFLYLKIDSDAKVKDQGIGAES